MMNLAVGERNVATNRLSLHETNYIYNNRWQHMIAIRNRYWYSFGRPRPISWRLNHL